MKEIYDDNQPAISQCREPIKDLQDLRMDDANDSGFNYCTNYTIIAPKPGMVSNWNIYMIY